MKVGDFVSIDVYRPASPVFMTTYKGFITEEKLSILRDGPSAVSYPHLTLPTPPYE